LARALEAGRQPAILPDWVRSVTYEVVATDLRADRGITNHQAELSTLLQELARPQPTRLRPDLARRSVAQLHHRDWAVLRLVLAGHQRAAVAARTGLSPAQVELAYSRARARLRAVVARDSSLREALSRAASNSAGLTGGLVAARATRRAAGLRPAPPQSDMSA
jgi:FixJ family two-component response regulator